MYRKDSSLTLLLAEHYEAGTQAGQYRLYFSDTKRCYTRLVW